MIEGGCLSEGFITERLFSSLSQLVGSATSILYYRSGGWIHKGHF